MISLVVQGLDSMLPLQETARVRSLVGELRSRKPGGVAKRKKYRNKPWRGDIYRQIGLPGSLKCHYICSFPQVNIKPPGTQYPGIFGLLTNISCHISKAESWSLFIFDFLSFLFYYCVLVAQLCPTLCDPMDCMWPTRLLWPWNSPDKNTGVSCHSLLQGIFPTQGSNLGLSHCRKILYCLSHQGSPTNSKIWFS